MLYNGEKCVTWYDNVSFAEDVFRSTIRLTLENISTLPVNFLSLSFEDSTVTSAQEAMAEGQLGVSEMYEIEYDLIHQRAFSWNGEKEIKVINPGQKIVVSVACFGKARW